MKIKDTALKVCKVIYSQLNKKNLDKVIIMIQKGTDMISEFGKALDNPNRKNQNVRSAFWGESKGTRKNTMSFYGEKMPFSSSKKIDFW